MAPPAKKVSQRGGGHPPLLCCIILRACAQRELRRNPKHLGRQRIPILFQVHPNGEAMDDKDARRRWYESFLPSTLTDSGEPRLLHCHTFHVNGFLASLTRAEAAVLANEPGIRQQVAVFETSASTKRSFGRSRPPAF
ncbi:hypothetical protein C2845_PM06G18740 [Panicum miliaceum]|uniref:Inhibitor I9 domain-containing protein n=1 Tax=Panicum miliaceum TaxID=4540 RepID=A0A3L6RCH0_PANMI|nr:hypothetical protein C2845_PM06G18740 [Panicum miliaceum]